MSRSFIARKVDGALREVMVRRLSDRLPLYIVNEYPKSGGTWLGQMLAALLDVPFPRNRMPVIRPSIMHGHYRWSSGMRNVVLIWRDGRDAMVSWYYHCLFKNERENARLVDIVRGDLAFSDWADIQSNLPTFLEYSFTRQKHPPFSWADFVREWHGRPHSQAVRYEDLRRDAVGELQRILGNLGVAGIDPERIRGVVDQFSFARQAGRKPGQEDRNSFMRKGVVGDWRNQFSPDARRVFDYYAGEELIKLGYEKDHSWTADGAVSATSPR